jgi:hypothetical protein
VLISSTPEGWVGGGKRDDFTRLAHLASARDAHQTWAALFLLGTVLTGLSVAMGLVYSYRYVPFPEPVSGLVEVITLSSYHGRRAFWSCFSVGIMSMVYGSTASAAS